MLIADVFAADPVAGTPLRPPALTPGDTIGIVAPSYSPNEHMIARGVSALRLAGFKVLLDDELSLIRRFRRTEDERRAESFTRMWLDPRVAAVMSATGGYGAARMLPHLDVTAFRETPKVFVGYSDITALHLWLNRRVGLRTFHGPTVDDLVSDATDVALRSLVDAVTHPRPTDQLGRGVARGVRPGRAIGRLAGGNLSLVQQSIGTPYEIQLDDAILFLEETRDPMSVVDERLLHLRAAGLLSRARGIVFGHLSLDRSEEDEFEDFLVDLVSDLDVPVLMDFPAGHENPNLTLPLGTAMELVVENDTGWLEYHDSALTPHRDVA